MDCRRLHGNASTPLGFDCRAGTRRTATGVWCGVPYSRKIQVADSSLDPTADGLQQDRGVTRYDRRQPATGQHATANPEPVAVGTDHPAIQLVSAGCEPKIRGRTGRAAAESDRGDTDSADGGDARPTITGVRHCSDARQCAYRTG